MNNRGKSFFTIDDVNKVIALPIAEGKKIALDIVEKAKALDISKVKARQLIDRQRSPAALAQLMANYMLAHPSEGLKAS